MDGVQRPFQLEDSIIELEDEATGEHLDSMRSFRKENKQLMLKESSTKCTLITYSPVVKSKLVV